MARRPDIPGMSRRGMSVVADLERTRFWPGAVAEALADWAAIAREPTRQHCEGSVCGSLRCCPDFELAGEILHALAALLPERDAKPLRRKLRQADDWPG